MVPKKANSRQIGGAHYKQHTQEPWDILRECFSAEEWQGFMLGSAIVYLLRRKGDGKDDVRKAQHFLEKFLEATSEEGN